MKIESHYPTFNPECPPDPATLGAAYDELRNDAIRLESMRDRLMTFLINSCPSIHCRAFLDGIKLEASSMHCSRPPLRVLVCITDCATGMFYYAREAAECRPQHEEGYRSIVASGRSGTVALAHYQICQ